MAIAVLGTAEVIKPVSLVEPVSSTTETQRLSREFEPISRTISEPEPVTASADKTRTNFTGISSGGLSVVSSGGSVGSKNELSEKEVEKTAEEMKKEGSTIAERIGKTGADYMRLIQEYRWQSVAVIGFFTLLLIKYLRE